MRQSFQVFTHFKSTVNSCQIKWGRDRDRKCFLGLNYADLLNERKDKERLFLEKILDVKSEIIPDRTHDNINILTSK